MKKILFLLLVTISSYAQTYQNPTFGTVTTKNAPTVTSVDYLASVSTTGIIGKIDPVNLPFSPVLSGTINYIPHFNTSSTLSDSYMYQTSDGVKIGNQNTTFGVGFSVSKFLTAINKHSFEDYSLINTTSGNEGFGVFDASTEMTGSNNNDHLNAYQSRLNYSASVGMTGPNAAIYGMTGYLAQNRVTGTGHLTVAKGFFARDLGGVAGTVDNLYGLHIDPQTKGSVTNWDIHATGKNNHFGAVMIGAVPAQWNAVDSFVNTGISNFSGLTKHTSQVRISSPSNTIPALQIGDYVGNFGWGIFESNTTGNLFVNSKNSGAVVQVFEIARNTGNTTFYGSITAPNATLTGTPTAPTATAGTNTTQVATTAFVQASTRPYKVYSAMISQVSTSAPTVTVMENTIGAIVWARTGVGTYTATLTGAFTASKVLPFLSNNANTNLDLKELATRTSNDVITLQTYATSVLTDGVISNMTIEIRVYN